MSRRFLLRSLCGVGPARQRVDPRTQCVGAQVPARRVDHSFIEPISTPLMKNLWMNGYTSRIGTVVTLT